MGSYEKALVLVRITVIPSVFQNLRICDLCCMICDYLVHILYHTSHIRFSDELRYPASVSIPF